MARSISFVVDEDVDTLVTITESGNGGLRFDVSVLGSGLLSDLRGFFFDLDGYDADAGGLSIIGIGANADMVVDANIGEAAVNRIGASANVNGQVIKTLGNFDVGVEFGTPGIGRDKVQEASFELVSATGPLTLDSLDLADLGLRYMSTGEKIAAATSGVARNDAFTVMENEQDTVDLLANDTNGLQPDGTRKTVTGAVNTDGSAFSTVGGGFEQAVVIGGLAFGTVTVSADGFVTFVADGADVDKLGHDAVRTFQFTYETISAEGNRATADVELTIDGVNDTPVASDVSGTVGEDDASDPRDPSLVGDGVTVAFSATDIDVGDKLTFVIISAPTDAFGNGYGTVVNNGDGTFTFNPLDNFQFLEAGETRDVTFEYVAIDDSGVGRDPSSPEESDTSVARTATITVVGAFDAPLDHAAPLLFETVDQSMFGTGAALVLQPQLPFLGFDTGRMSLDATIIPSYTFGGDVLSGIVDGIEALADFFAGLFGEDVSLPDSVTTPRVGTAGFLDARVGLQPYFHLTSGDVDASVPVDVWFEYPRQIEAGNTFLIDSMYSIDGGATFSTMSPNVNFGMDLVFDIAAELALQFGSAVTNLFSFDTREIDGFTGVLGEPGFNIFDFSAEDDLEASIDLGGLATLDLNLPVIETTGEQDAPGSETLASEGEDDVAVLDIDVDAVVASLIKAATGVPVTFGESNSLGAVIDIAGESLNLLSVGYAWDLMAVNLITTLKAIQEFELNIQDLPLMALLEDGSTIDGFSIGDRIEVYTPATSAFDVDVDGDADGFMDFIVDVDMNAVFSNLTTLGLDMDLFTGLLRFDVAVTSDFASDLPEFSLFDPNGDDGGFLLAETTSLISDAPIATLFDEEFTIEGWSSDGTDFIFDIA